MKETLAEWLRQRFSENPQINQTSLAISLKLGQSTISNWLRGVALPDPENCHKLATYFHIPTETILTLAGHLQPNPTIAEAKGAYRADPPALGEAVNLFRSLNDDDQERILIYMRALVHSQKSEHRRAEGPVQEAPASG